MLADERMRSIRWRPRGVAGRICGVGLLTALAVSSASGDRPPGSTGSRTFAFDYGAALGGLAAGAEIRVWLPVPQTTEHQRVSELDRRLPAPATVGVETKYGNRMLFFQLPAPADGRVEFSTRYLVRRREVRGLRPPQAKVPLTVAQRRVFLAANQRVPVNGEKVDRLVADIATSKDPLETARALYDRVDAHVRYDKSQPGYGNGDVLWVCDSRFGNCTDFHSLFISLARNRGVPARFEIGFPLPAQRGAGKIGGYHCWALFHTKQRGWVPVDISEADKNPLKRDYFFGNLTEDRVSFTTGRDITLVPKQSGPPLNYFVYPYVEVDGRPLANKQIQLAFSYADEASADAR